MATPLLPESPDEKARARDYAKRMQEALISVGFWHCCLNCEHWTVNTVIGETDLVDAHKCSKWNAVPPPDVICVGCPDWKCEVPF